MTGLETSTLDDRHKVLFRLIDKVNHDSSSITAADLDTARAAGWTDEALYFAITVCALFNFYNRWIDATGVHSLSDEAHREGGKLLALHGYAGPPERVDDRSALTYRRRGALWPFGSLGAFIAFLRTFWASPKPTDTASRRSSRDWVPPFCP